MNEVVTDRRGEDRFPCLFRPFVRLLVRPSFRCLDACVLNASPTGLGLLLDGPLEVGSVLAVQIRGARRGRTGVHSATVVHCTGRADGTWLAGCKLADHLPAEALRLLQATPPRPYNDPDSFEVG